MKQQPDRLDKARKVMGALVQQPPKPHEQMKIGKAKTKTGKSVKRPSLPSSPGAKRG